MKGQFRYVFIAIALLCLLCSTVMAAPVTQNITYQGMLTNAAGTPLTGTYTVTFKLYEVSSGGSALATDTHSVQASKGVFTTQITAASSFFDGRALWLGITVDADAEMTPRQELRPVPYALSLRPGMKVMGDISGYVLNITNNGLGYNKKGLYVETIGQNSAAIYAYTTGPGSNAVVGVTKADGPAAIAGITSGVGSYGLYASTTGQFSPGVWSSTSNTSSPGVYVVTSGQESYGIDVLTTKSGSRGVNITTIASNGDGVRAITKGSNSKGFLASTRGDMSDGVYASVVGNSSNGVYGEAWGTPNNYLESNGVVGYSIQSNGVVGSTARADHMYGVYTRDYMSALGYQTNAGDVAEYMPVIENVNPGTVLAIGPDGKLQPSTTAYDTRVAGIVSTAPGVFLGVKGEGNSGEAQVAVAGRVPCNVDAGYGAIHPGDLLTTSNNPGYAMKAANPKIGTILGKAMGSLENGTGTIEVLVTLQ